MLVSVGGAGGENMSKKKAKQVIGYIDPHWVEKQIAYEDMMQWVKRKEPAQVKEVMAKELPAQKWEPAPLYVFGVNLRRLKGLIA
jgi:hypothetical protein